MITEPTAPVPQAVARAIARVLGREARFVCSPGTYDQKHIARIGHLQDCVAYGPGILDLAHQPDEYVAIDDLVASAKVLALAALSLLERESLAASVSPPGMTGGRHRPDSAERGYGAARQAASRLCAVAHVTTSRTSTLPRVAFE